MAKSQLNRIKNIDSLSKAIGEDIYYSISGSTPLKQEDMYDIQDEALNEEEDIKVGTCSVTIDETHGCCAKAHLFDFRGEDLKDTEGLIKAGELIARKRKYTLLGLTHRANSPAVKAAKRLGWKVLRKFQNKRTGNSLVDMYKEL